MNPEIKKEALYRKINEGIAGERSSAFRSNLRKNNVLIEKYGGLKRVIPLLSGKNVIIIGAGPSLDDQYAVIKKYHLRRDIVLIASDMALLPLAGRKIFPQFVISCETTPRDFFRSVTTENMHLLAFSCMSSANLRQWKGDISFYNWMLHGEPWDGLWKSAGEDLGYVATASIVTSQAVSLALGCGIKSMVLVGNDLGFHHRYYARHTVSGRGLALRNDRGNPPETIEASAVRRARHYDIRRGDGVYFTSGQFLSARLWMEELFKSRNEPIYDSSTPGCDGSAVRKIGLKKYFEGLDNRPRRR